MCHSLITASLFTFQQDSALTFWLLEQVTSQFILPDQTDPSLTQWTTVSVALPNSMSTSPLLCIHNVNELKQHLLDVWYRMRQSIIDSAINEGGMSLQDCLRLKQEILSKCCNINNWLNRQRYHLCETLMLMFYCNFCKICAIFERLHFTRFSSELCCKFLCKFHFLSCSKRILTKRLAKANKSQTLFRYSITYHYDLISVPTTDANQKNSCIRR